MSTSHLIDPRPYHNTILLVLAVFLSACNSLHSNAKILMEGEDYGEAAKVYSQILEQDPQDAKAIVGLRKARLGWLDIKLLDVRMLRLADQSVAATDLFLEVINREREWQFYPEGAVQYTQEEETRFAERFITAQVDVWQAKKLLLQARAFLAHYHPIFATSVRTKNYEVLRSRMTKDATEQCREESESLSAGLPYWAAFIKRYCESWGVSLNPGFDLTKQLALHAYSTIEVTANADTIPQALQAEGKQRLTNVFQRTAWYDSQAPNTLPVEVSAGFSNNHSKNIEHTVHSYTIRVPYTAMIPQMRTVPHTTYQQSCNAYGCINIPNTTYSYEWYTVPMTQYRDEPRRLEYDRWRHRQILVFHAEMRSVVEDTEANAVTTEKSEETDTEHPHSMPNIGLYPDPLTLPDPLKWLERQIDMAANQWSQALSEAWIRLYCTEPSAAVTGPELGDYVFRCFRGHPRTMPAFVTTWFKQRFDAGQDDVEQWLAQKENVPHVNQESAEVNRESSEVNQESAEQVEKAK